MRKDVLSILLSASLICGLMPIDGIGQKASAAKADNAGSVHVLADQNEEESEETKEEITASGTFGGTKDEVTGEMTVEDNLSWSLSSEGILTISGEGAMPTYTTTTYTTVPWYEYAADIQKVVFTEGVTSVGDYAFFNTTKIYTSLTEVDISKAENLTKVGDYAFRFTGIDTVTGIERLTSIGKYAFGGTKLISVYIPGITTASQGLFYGCKELVSLDLPKVETMEGQLVYACTALTEVNLPSVTTCGHYEFNACTALTKICMPELTTISGNGTFSGCTSLKEVELPKLKKVTNGTQYASDTFKNCTSLQKISLPALEYGGSFYMFSGCTSLTDVELPEMIEGGKWMFQNCTSLIDINLPKVRRISNMMFQNCYTLKEVNIPNVGGEYTSALGGSATGEIDNEAFGKCYALDYLELPDTLKKLSYAITAPNLKRIYFRGTATANVSSSYLSGLKADIYVPYGTEEYFSSYTGGSVIPVGSEGDDAETIAAAFDALLAKENKLRITCDNVDEPASPAPSVAVNTANTEVTYEYFTDQACTNSVAVADLTPGDYFVRATAAGNDNYFATASNIVPFTLYGEMKGEGYTLHNKTWVLTITDVSVITGDYASASAVPWYGYRTNITSVTVSDTASYTKIGAYAFYGMTGMVSFDLPDTVTSVGQYAFYNCQVWEETVDITLSEIGQYAFDNCYLLSGTVVLADGVTEIPAFAFGYCKSINSIEVPDSVTTIGNQSFGQCESLKTIHIPTSITALPDYFLVGCRGITQIEIPDGVTTVGNYAFNNCNSLETIEIPDSVTTLGNSAFSSCSLLETIEIPESVTTLGASVFSSCSLLKKVIIPDTVTSIAGGLFNGCTGLEYVEFESDSYTTDTLRSAKVNDVDCWFRNVPSTAIVICEGSTYDTLKGYADSTTGTSYPWSTDILYKQADILALYQAELMTAYKKVLLKGDYDEDLLAEFRTVLSEAEELAEAGETTYEKVMNQIAARKQVVTSVRVFLQDTYKKAVALIETDYDTSADSWWDYLDAVDDARIVLTSDSSTISDILDKDSALKTAMSGLDILPTDDAEAALDKVLEDMEGLTESDYTADSWKALQDAVTEAEAIKVTGTVSQIEAAQKSVEDALEALEKVDTTATVSALDTVISNANALKKTDYTADSWKALQDAVVEAEKVKETGTISEIEAVQKKVQNALDALVKAATNPGINSGTGTNTPALSQKPGTVKKPTVKKVTIKKAKSSKKKTMLVQWKKLSNVTGYEVRIATNKKFTKGKKTYIVKKAKTVKKTIKKLKSKKTYYVEVRAYKTVSGNKYCGSWSKVKKVKIK